ncbi:hypothetical protein [Archangium violaceum]|uniref:Uncharacterized protein n=1 Tax=Archangium violaceum Cb vi76 TaxID=1406225 RepID=A0A084SQ34_9BACT|nr:hypothetical protein [Archangium violaceum]KFA90569.1 hypothetical protein Q664_27275 [Archangium violaceum Cb vi76]
MSVQHGRAHVAMRVLLVMVLASTDLGCLAIQTVRRGGIVFAIPRLKSRLDKEPRPVDPADPEELFARESFSAGSYIFVMLNRAAVSTLEVTPDGLFLKGAERERASGRAVQILEDFHKDTRASLDPTNESLQVKYYWYTHHDLVTPRWEGDAPLKIARDQFYEDLKNALARHGGQPVVRVRMPLVAAQSRKEPGAPELVACVVVHDDSFHEPRNYFAYLAGVEPTQVKLEVKDRSSVRELDAKLQAYLCRAEFRSLDPRPGSFVGSKTLYQSVVTSYLGRRSDTGGRLDGLEFISRYLAATIINAFQRGVEPPHQPVGLFVETKIRQMHENEGDRRFVMHRFVEGERGKVLAKALVDAVELIERASRTRPPDEDALAHKLRLAREFSDDSRLREPVRRVLKMFLESAFLLMPEYTKNILHSSTAVKVSVRTGATR